MKRALGRGLSALIPPGAGQTTVAGERATALKEGINYLPVMEIQPSPHQPRQDVDPEKLNELIASIKEKGLIQPVLVRQVAEGFELIAGERRWRAAKQLGLKEIPAMIKNVEDKDALELSLIENIQRQDLNPIEEARAYQYLAEHFNFTQDEIAQAVGKARVSVANILRLLKLPSKIQEWVRKGELDMAHARSLLSLEEPAEQMSLAQKVIEKGLSVRQIEALVKNRLLAKRSSKMPRKKDVHAQALEEELQRILGTRVKIIQRRKRGRIVIDFYSLDDLDRILALLRRHR